MRKIILPIIILIVLFINFSPQVMAAKKFGRFGECAYCGYYVVFGDTKPFDECFDRIQDCFKVSKRMPGQSVDACMCIAQIELAAKYNKWDLLQRNLGWLYGAAGAAAGVGLPGAGLINPDERNKLLGEKGSFGDYLDQLGDFGGRLGEIGSGVAHAVEDSDEPLWQRMVGGATAVLPEGRGKTATGFINAVGSLK